MTHPCTAMHGVVMYISSITQTDDLTKLISHPITSLMDHMFLRISVPGLSPALCIGFLGAPDRVLLPLLPLLDDRSPLASFIRRVSGPDRDGPLPADPLLRVRVSSPRLPAPLGDPFSLKLSSPAAPAFLSPSWSAVPLDCGGAAEGCDLSGPL